MLHTILAVATLLVKPARPTLESPNLQPFTNTCVSLQRAVLPANTLMLHDAKLQAELKSRLTAAFREKWGAYVREMAGNCKMQGKR